jgi:hypothetical protein
MRTLSYKVPRTSVTGKKFEAYRSKTSQAHKAIVLLAKEYGFTQWRMRYWGYGGLSTVYFPDNLSPDPKTWKKCHDGYMPKKSTKTGVVVSDKFMDLPFIPILEKNMCIGFNSKLDEIGINFNNPSFVLFEVYKSWGIKIPKDCVEITGSEYEKLSIKK